MSEEYVDTTSGSGFGSHGAWLSTEDYEIGYRNNIIPFNSLSEIGVFDDASGPFSGLTAKKDDKLITEKIRGKKYNCCREQGTTRLRALLEMQKPSYIPPTTQWFFKIEDLKKTE